jgi:hypothetical protein
VIGIAAAGSIRFEITADYLYLMQLDTAYRLERTIPKITQLNGEQMW